MLKYVSSEIERLLNLKSGMEKNPETWVGQTITSAAVQAKADELDKIGKEVDDLQRLISSKLAEARNLTKSAQREADNITSIAIGLENSDPAKLAGYGINLRKEKMTKPAPTTAHHIDIIDDTDKEGFNVSTNSDPDASIYEWQKGISADASTIDTIPEMKFFKATKKSSFVDNDVVKGIRYFYRVRATNSAGVGPWSEAVSKVQ